MAKGITTLQALKRSARSLNDELAFAEGFRRAEFRTGYVRFTPRQRRDAKLIVHEDQDVICLVLAGRGRLRRGDRSVPVRPGTICHIPAGTPHDFSAVGEPLELLYTTVRVREEK